MTTITCYKVTHARIHMHACVHTHNRFKALCILSTTTRVSWHQKGETRNVKPIWVAVASARPYANLHLTQDNHINIPPLCFTGHIPFLSSNQQYNDNFLSDFVSCLSDKTWQCGNWYICHMLAASCVWNKKNLCLSTVRNLKHSNVSEQLAKATYERRQVIRPNLLPQRVVIFHWVTLCNVFVLSTCTRTSHDGHYWHSDAILVQPRAYSSCHGWISRLLGLIHLWPPV